METCTEQNWRNFILWTINASLFDPGVQQKISCMLNQQRKIEYYCIEARWTEAQCLNKIFKQTKQKADSSDTVISFSLVGRVCSKKQLNVFNSVSGIHTPNHWNSGLIKLAHVYKMLINHGTNATTESKISRFESGSISLFQRCNLYNQEYFLLDWIY